MTNSAQIPSIAKDLIEMCKLAKAEAPDSDCDALLDETITAVENFQRHFESGNKKYLTDPN